MVVVDVVVDSVVESWSCEKNIVKLKNESGNVFFYKSIISEYLHDDYEEPMDQD